MYGMMIHGEVFKVEDKTVGTDMRVAEIAVKSVSADQKGRPIEVYYDVRVSPEQVRDGLHNAIRMMVGSIIFLPVSCSIYEGRKPVQQYNLAGLPVKLQAVPQQQAVKATA